MKLKLLFLILSFWSYEISSLIVAVQPQLVFTSHVFRVLTVIVGILLLVNQKDKLALPSRSTVALTIFLIIYLLRVCIDSLYFGVISTVGNTKYLLIHFSSNLLPVLIIAFVKFHSSILSQFIRISIYLLALVIGFAILNGLDDYLKMALAKSSGSIRFDSQKISPIQLGHYGVSILLMTWLSAFRDSTSLLAKVFLTVLSFAAIILGNSKGPIVALALVYIAKKVSEANGGLKAISNILASIMAIIMVWFTFNYILKIDLLDRFYGVLKSSDTSTVSRILSIREAWSLFVGSPILGSSFVTRNGGYPHNIVLESLMSTGLLGTVLLFYSTRWALKGMSFRFLNSRGIYLLFLQWLIAFMFSFSLYQGAIVFVSLALITSIRSEKGSSVLL